MTWLISIVLFATAMCVASGIAYWLSGNSPAAWAWLTAPIAQASHLITLLGEGQ